MIEPSNLKSYRPILDEAQSRRVLIYQSNVGDLVILRNSELSELDATHEFTVDAAQFLLAVNRCEERRPRLHELGRLAWAADLTEDSFREFADEFVASFASAALRHDWDRHRDFLEAWRLTAEVEAEPELAAAILDNGDPRQHRDLKRP